MENVKKSICVFCGSGTGTNPIYQNAARQLGRLMAKYNITLVYGGGSIGLMGILADEIMGQNGKVTGVIPKFLYDLEVGHDGVSELIIVDSMHQRKEKMAELANAFLALPGGIGTLEEMSEILTWIQLKLIDKPIGLLNINGFYDHFLSQLDIMVKESFLSKTSRNILYSTHSPEKILEMLMEKEPYNNQEFIQKGKT
jgi:uncharacterized protein (TIGR00730 family)